MNIKKRGVSTNRAALELPSTRSWLPMPAVKFG